MGVNLAPIMVKHYIRLQDLTGRRLAVDANNYLYTFLALIRTPLGFPLQASSGTVTSHLAGLLFRSTRLIWDYGILLIFVFDGEPPKLKEGEIEKRRQLREKATIQWKKALAAGNHAKAFSKAVMTSRLTRPMIEDSKKLLRLLGIPYVQAPSEAEAQAAHMAIRDDVWASSSRDYDSLLFGAPRLQRYLTIQGKEFLPSKGIARALIPELIDLSEFLSKNSITHEQLVDLAILIGTDFNPGVKGIGPKRALKIIRQHKSIDYLPEDLQKQIPVDYDDVKKLFLKPQTISNYNLDYSALEENGLYTFLCEERDFSRKRVESAVERIKTSGALLRQENLRKWLAP